MNIKKQFQYNPEVEVSAAQIGISKWNWISIDNSDVETAKSIMRKNRFDVLPIIDSKGIVKSYFSTQEWNEYDNLNKTKIQSTETRQTIYYRLSLKDLIRKFKNEDRHYYFLTDYDEILGLVSYVNLNCQLVYNYLFFVLADIERSVSDLLKRYIPEEKVLEVFGKSDDRHLKGLVKNYHKNINSNNDNDIFQTMYLQTVGISIKHFLDDLPIEYRKLGKYSSKFSTGGVYNSIRNKVMHPVRPILSDRQSIEQIDELLDDYTEIKNIVEKPIKP
jgi:hypothetical protein